MGRIDDVKYIGAPILITTLNRHIHFVRLIESLKLNTWARYTDVYIGLDYPANESHVEGYNEICNYLNQDFSVFNSFVVIKREVNYGSFKNMEDLRNIVLSKYDCFIRTDDDAEFAPNFLEYMNKCLDEYKNDEDVVAVTGYTYPVEWNVSDSSTIFKENFICPMWGTGFWASKYKKIENLLVKEKLLQKEARKIISNGGCLKMSDVCCKEFSELCLSPDYDITLAASITDISMRMYLSAYDKYIIMPVVSKVRNHGFDGTGEFCSKVDATVKNISSKAYPYANQPIDGDMKFDLILDTRNDIVANKCLMNKFDSISFLNQIKTYLKLFLFLILGLSNYHRATLAIRRLKSTCKVKELLRLVQHA